MMNFIEIIIVLSVSVAVMFINYLVFAHSKISPYYIEFDERRKSEIRLMNSYNEGFRKIFYIYIFTCVTLSLMLLASFCGFVAMVLMTVQLLYTVLAFLAMLWMYIRSVLYWEREFKREENIRKASHLSDATNILVF